MTKTTIFRKENYITDALVAMLFFVSKKLTSLSFTKERGMTTEDWVQFEPVRPTTDLFIFKMADETTKKVKELMAKKDAIEKEIKEFQEVLDSVRPLS